MSLDDYQLQASQDFALFKEHVLAHLDPVRALGYETADAELPLLLNLTRYVILSIECRISFQLIGNSVSSPDTDFNVWLYRKSLSEDGEANDSWLPIAITF